MKDLIDAPNPAPGLIQDPRKPVSLPPWNLMDKDQRRAWFDWWINADG